MEVRGRCTWADDTVQLENAIFAAPAEGALGLGEFLSGAGITATSATDAGHHILYNTTTGALYYDPDGLGGSSAIQFTSLLTKPVISSADFMVC